MGWRSDGLLLVSIMVSVRPGDGDQACDFVDVRDVVEVLVTGIDWPVTFSVVGGRQFTVLPPVAGAAGLVLRFRVDGGSGVVEYELGPITANGPPASWASVTAHSTHKPARRHNGASRRPPTNPIIGRSLRWWWETRPGVGYAREAPRIATYG